jgi:predicted O-methyltransferase YrrM
LENSVVKSFSKKRVIDLIRADSHSKETVLKLRKALKGQGVDFLFIDGDHTYEGVRKDFEMYFPFVRKGGIVAFHDVIQHDLKAGCHVDKFWHEIKQKYENEEFVEDKNQHWAGIGVLYI